MPEKTSSSETGLVLRSRVDKDGTLSLWLADEPIPAPGPDEVVIQVQAAPINPSDVSLLTAPADPSSLVAGGSAERPTLQGKVSPQRLPALAARIGRDLPVGNEGAGKVVRAGENATHLQGRTVAVFGGGMYAQYRLARADDCMVLPEGVTAADGASAFVNPLTALCMVETMRREGHHALVLTAAAAGLGQMLNKVCQEDGIGLVNIVRRAEQAKLLRGLGAKHACNSSDPDFMDQLTQALRETRATIAFDAVVGGPLAGQILNCMEVVAREDMTEYSPYGSPVHKQVYLFGGLDPGPTEIERKAGMGWGVGGWLMPWVLGRLGPARVKQLRERVAASITTTFASHYNEQISLADVLRPQMVERYAKASTSGKLLVDPTAA